MDRFSVRIVQQNTQHCPTTKNLNGYVMHALGSFSKGNDTNPPLRLTNLAQAELIQTVSQKSHRQILAPREGQVDQVCGMSKFTD